MNIKNIDFIKSQVSLEKPIVLKPSMFGFEDIENTFSPVSICIVDTGCPVHSAMRFSNSSLKNMYIDFSGNEAIPWDQNGHSTAVSGIIAGKSDLYSGLCPSAFLRYARCIDFDGKSNIKKIAAGILWGSVTESDIILVAAGTEEKDRYMEEIVSKAIKNGSIIVAAGCGNSHMNNKKVFPGMLDGVFSCSFGNTSSISVKNKNGFDIMINHRSCWTLAPENKYIRLGGSSIASAILAGIVAAYMSCGKTKDDIIEIFRNNKYAT